MESGSVASSGQSESLFVDGGYAATCAICGAGAVHPVIGGSLTCPVCGSTASVRQCRGCKNVALFNPVIDGAANHLEVRCQKCGRQVAKWRWREARISDLSGAPNPWLSSLYRRQSLSLVGCAKDPDRRSVSGLLMRRVAGVPDVVVGQGQLIFEHSIALIIAGSDSGAEFVVPYADVESLSFSEPDLQVSRRPFTRKAVPATSVELAWQSGRITLLHNGASPATCLDRYAVVYRRIDAARAAARAAAGDPAPDTSDLVGSLKELSLMHESGALTADEFATAKARLLGIAPEVGEGSHEE